MTAITTTSFNFCYYFSSDGLCWNFPPFFLVKNLFSNTTLKSNEATTSTTIKDSSFLMKKGHHNVQAKSNSVCFCCFFCNDSKKKSSAWFQNAILSPIFFDSSSGLCETPLEILQVTCVHHTPTFLPQKMGTNWHCPNVKALLCESKRKWFFNSTTNGRKIFCLLGHFEDISALRKVSHNTKLKETRISSNSKKREKNYFSYTCYLGEKRLLLFWHRNILTFVWIFLGAFLFCKIDHLKKVRNQNLDKNKNLEFVFLEVKAVCDLTTSWVRTKILFCVCKITWYSSKSNTVPEWK